MRSTIGVVLILVLCAHRAGGDGLGCFTDPQVGALAHGGSMQFLVSNGDIVYASIDPDTMLVIDLSEPFAPSLIETLQVGGRIRQMSVSEGLLAVPTFDAGVQIFDVHKPASPQLVSVADPAGSYQGVEIVGDVLACAASDELVLIDVGDRDAPEVIGRIAYERGSAQSIAVVGSLVIMATTSGMESIDISDPRNPLYRHRVGVSSGVIDLEPNEDGVLVAVSRLGGIRTYEISDAGEFANLDVFTVDELFPWDIQVDRGTAIVGGNSFGTLLFDVSDPGDITYLTGYDRGTASLGMALVGDHIAISTGVDGLSVIEHRGGATPVLGVVAPGSFTGDFASEGSVLFRATGPALISYEVLDPRSIETLQYLPLGDSVGGIAALGGLVFAAADDRGLVIVDASDPAAMRELSNIVLPSGAGRVDANGTHAYVIGQAGELFVIDILDPGSPELTRTLRLNDDFHRVAVGGDVLFVSRGSVLRAYDITDPSDPRFVGGIELDRFIEEIRPWGEMVVAGFRGRGASTLRFDGAFEQLSLSGGPGSGDFVEVGEGRLFVSERADRDEGVAMYDLSDPASPELVARFRTFDIAQHLHRVGDTLFVNDIGRGVWVLDLADSCASCDTDLDANGELDVLDVLEFIDALLAGDQSADRDGDGMWTFFDLVDYIDEFAAGCP